MVGRLEKQQLLIPFFQDFQAVQISKPAEIRDQSSNKCEGLQRLRVSEKAAKYTNISSRKAQGTGVQRQPEVGGNAPRHRSFSGIYGLGRLM